MKQKLSWILEGFFLILLLLVTILIYVPEQSEHLLHIRMIQVTGKNKEKAVWGIGYLNAYVCEK